MAFRQVASLGKSGVSVGYYDTEEQGARAYDRAAIGLLGHHNCSVTTNFPLSDYDTREVCPSSVPQFAAYLASFHLFESQKSCNIALGDLIAKNRNPLIMATFSNAGVVQCKQPQPQVQALRLACLAFVKMHTLYVETSDCMLHDACGAAADSNPGGPHQGGGQGDPEDRARQGDHTTVVRSTVAMPHLPAAPNC